ncbi:hypothetical protein B0T10DRAFT_551325 [Thelonectria olida]|uniref:Uncharacterized protein n=1 Tax=Thelonectria olida TaxID=1576542 RepID=A0A9P9ALS6_9HYPO|nr:hypothetical protein B0T10DRAFT_551325 [Thelonectria olida]
MMQSVLPKFLIALSLQRVGCWRPSGPTAPPLSDNRTAPAPTQAPLRRADFDPEGSTLPPCAQLSGDASMEGVSDYIFNCPADQICNILYPEGNYWGCCKEVPVPGCITLNCPTYSSCIDSTALGCCDSDCMTDSGILKCSGSAKPFCAIGSASMSTLTGGLTSSPPLTTLSQYACADYPYTLHYTVFEDYLDIQFVCAPPWVTNPTSLAAWSKSAAPEVSAGMIQDFADPFDQVVARVNFSASTVLSSANCTIAFVPTVQIPTAASATSTTSSAGVRRAVSPTNIVYILSLLFAGQFLLS